MQLKTNKSVTLKMLSEESNRTEEKQTCTIKAGTSLKSELPKIRKKCTLGGNKYKFKQV